jgi:hypothetical protein
MLLDLYEKEKQLIAEQQARKVRVPGVHRKQVLGGAEARLVFATQENMRPLQERQEHKPAS